MSYTISPETLECQYDTFDFIIRNIMEAVGFISGGFCPEPCQHTTLQYTNRELYDVLTAIWKDYNKYRTELLTILSLRDDPEALMKYLLTPGVLAD